MSRADIERLLPGLDEARRSENEWRALSFFEGIEHTVCGIKLRMLTARTVFELRECGNPVLGEGEISRAALFDFYWRLHADFTRPGTFKFWLTRWKRKRLARAVNRLNIFIAREAVLKWVEMHYIDAPPRVTEVKRKDNHATATGYAWIASFVDFFCEHYHWSLNDVLDAPLPLLFQLYRANRARKGIDTELCSPSERMVDDFIRGVAKLKSEQDAKDKEKPTQ